MSKTIELTATKMVSGVEKSGTIYIEFGDTAIESIDMFGDAIVNSNFIANSKVIGQAAIRRDLEKGLSQEELTVHLAGWKPGVAISHQTDPIAAAKAKFKTLTPEEQRAFITELQNQAA